ncbi:MAG: hypothetical protein DHS20C18_50520 [Saprospiraceae bacterium]|nr:MAG: hypothetical protein DHS20C18_50520 [Saprospiraceae bacterium]
MFKKYLAWSLMTWAPLFVCAQQVTTLSMNSGIDDALILDAQGHLYGAHYQGSAVFHVSPDDWSSEVYSDGFNTPNGLAFDDEGILYMADNLGNKIYRIFPDGTSEVFVDNFVSPSGLIFELDSDTLIATSYGGNRIEKIAPDKERVIVASGNGLNGPVGLCYDDDGNLYVGNFTNRKIFRLEENGELELISQPSGSGWLGFITYAKGYIYGTLYSQHKIYRTDLMGNDTIILGGGAGTVDGGPDEARFNQPNGILASPSQDTIFVSDYGNRALRMITGLEPLTSKTTPKSKDILNWQLSPNPATSNLQVELQLDHSAKVSIKLFDNQGKQMAVLLHNTTMGSGAHVMPFVIADYPAGTYHIQVDLDKGLPFSKSFIKK